MIYRIQKPYNMLECNNCAVLRVLTAIRGLCVFIVRDFVYTVFHKIGTPLHVFNNIFKC